MLLILFDCDGLSLTLLLSTSKQQIVISVDEIKHFTIVNIKLVDLQQ